MTTMIDHAIAIPTRPSNVWEQIGDISKNQMWQPNCERVQFLTSSQSGRGTRWRSTPSRGKEQVIEITAWYDGLGYEYRIVDGVPYADNRGRIRLQDSPEGTIVQWTFSYELTGVLGGLRNALSTRRGIDNDIVDGLRNLYVYIRDTKSDEPLLPEESKSFLKAAPDVTARSQYQPRYPSAMGARSDLTPAFRPQQSALESNPLAIEEPPLTDEDTHPNPSVQVAAEVKAPEPVKPEPLPRLDEPEEETLPASQDSTPATLEDKPRAQAQPGVVEPLATGHEVNKLDTAKISVFEVFGLEKPSETEQVQTLSEKPVETKSDEPITTRPFGDSAPIIPDIDPEVPRRRGLRAALRRKSTHVRRPK